MVRLSNAARRKTMKKFVAKRLVAPVALAFFALMTLGAAARVYAQDPAIEAKVPFSFNVGADTLPPNTYTVTANSPGVVEIHSPDKRVMVTTAAYNGNIQSDHGSKLVFSRYGDQYFLRRILRPGVQQLTVEIPVSDREKQARSHEAESFTPEEISVDAQ
jgi:hypothetical protein